MVSEIQMYYFRPRTPIFEKTISQNVEFFFNFQSTPQDTMTPKRILEIIVCILEEFTCLRNKIQKQIEKNLH